MDRTVVNFLSDRGYDIEEMMYDYIATWKSWYKGNVEGFHNYRVYNGIQSIPQTRASLQLGKSMSEQLGNMLYNEKCGMAISDPSTDAFVKDIFDRNNMYIKLNESQEKKAATGTMCYIPYYANGTIKMNYVQADHIIPLSSENGVITEAAVYSPVTVGGDEYFFAQLFTLDDENNYVIENILLRTDPDGDSYKEIEEIGDIPGYEEVEARVETKSQTKPFIIDRLNIANNIDPDSPLGLAVFANSIDSMKLCDTIYDSYLNEFNLGKKRVMVSAEAMNIQSGTPTFDPNDLVYYRLPEGSAADDKPFIHELNMSLRTADHQIALQQGLNIFSSQCGLGENFYRYEAGGVVTATQVISENTTMFRTLKKHEIILEAVLVDLIRLIIEIAVRYHLVPEGGGTLDPEAEITITFDDSIIEDKNTELARRLSEVAAGLLRPELYLAYRYGVTEEEALKMMPGMETPKKPEEPEEGYDDLEEEQKQDQGKNEPPKGKEEET